MLRQREEEGSMESDVRPIIGMPDYDSVDMLDVTGPYEMFTWAGFEIELVAAESRMHCFREGFRFEVLKSFAEASPTYAALWVPGGDPAALNVLMRDETYLGFLRDKAAVTPMVASVCEGAMLLSAAGFLDRDRLTGGGISSGLDEALRLIELLSGTSAAEQVQLMTQYYPSPPVGGAIPDTDDCPLDTAGDKMPLCIPC
jgi:transcriptional regulator GlxA family with amidase domain